MKSTKWFTTVALSIIASMTMAACSDHSPAPHPKKATGGSHGDPVIVFVRPNETMLADASGHTWRIATLNAPIGPVRWSPDGTRLVWLDARDQSDASTRLTMVRVSDGKIFTAVCPCRGLGFLGRDAAALSADGSALVLMGPDGTPKRLLLDKKLPSYSQLAAGGRDHVTLASTLDERKVGVRGQSTMVAADGSGHITPLLPASSMTSFVSGLAAPDGQHLTWENARSGGACYIEDNLVVLDGKGSAPVEPPLPDDPTFRSAFLKDQRIVLSYSWAGTGLVMTFSPIVGCQVQYPFRLVSYYREGNRWSLLGTGSLAVGYGAQGRSVHLKPPANWQPPKDDPLNSVRGTLLLTDASGTEKVLADNVSTFSFSPQEAAVAHPSPGPPPTLMTTVTTDDTGKSLSDPRYELYKQIKQAADHGDTEQLRALCTGCQAAALGQLSTPDDLERLQLVLRTHPTLKMGNLVFPGLAQHPCIDEPGDPITCTPEQIQDIATLNLKAEANLDHQNYYTLTKATFIMLDPSGHARWSGPPAP